MSEPYLAPGFKALLTSMDFRDDDMLKLQKDRILSAIDLLCIEESDLIELKLPLGPRSKLKNYIKELKMQQ